MTVAQVQQLHIIEESTDSIKRTSMVTDSTNGQWQGRDKRITNVSDPVDSNDVVTKGYIEGTQSNLINTMTAVKNTCTTELTTLLTQGTVSSNKATVEADRAKTEADRATREADRAKAEADRVNSIPQSEKGVTVATLTNGKLTASQVPQITNASNADTLGGKTVSEFVLIEPFNALSASVSDLSALSTRVNENSFVIERLKHIPQWWLNRGNAERGDKVCVNNETISGVLQYKNFTVPAGVTVKVDGFARILCTETFVNNGTISADGTGGLGGRFVFEHNEETKVTINKNYPAENSFGGGAGGASYDGGVGGGVDISCRGFIYAETMQNVAGTGGGGGSWATEVGARGGGSVQVICAAFKSTGTISTKGVNGNPGIRGGGGGGGLVFICCNTLLNQGTIITTGGTGGSSNGRSGANGGNGPIIIKEIGL